MDWSEKLVDFWCAHYYQIREYELNPFQEISTFRDELYIHGRPGYNSPYEELVGMNIDFDRSLKKLGIKEKEFRAKFIDGTARKNKLYKKFVQILVDSNQVV